VAPTGFTQSPEPAFSSARPQHYRYPMPAFPYGWLALCFSDELEHGQLLALHRQGRDLVLWRDSSGTARAADAYCPHLGAHLGHGGQVIDGELRCPFHHWRYAGDGACVHAGPAKRIPAAARLGMYTTCERNRLVFAWFGAAGQLPAWQIESIPEIESGGYREVRRHLWTVRSHPQEMMENAVDVTHFESMHRWRALSIDWVPDGPRFQMQIRVDNSSAGYQSATAVNADAVVSFNVGPGFSYTRFSGALRAVSLNIMTPTEAGVVHNPQSFWVAPDIDQDMAAAWAQGFLDDYADDIPVWEHKIYRDRPALSDADGPFARFRRWYAQFYT
jgi:phenylpropionate dioxygenase-like ring-hydroxylating dioxygenase large terminal subunit